MDYKLCVPITFETKAALEAEARRRGIMKGKRPSLSGLARVILAEALDLEDDAIEPEAGRSTGMSRLRLAAALARDIPKGPPEDSGERTSTGAGPRIKVLKR